MRPVAQRSALVLLPLLLVGVARAQYAQRVVPLNGVPDGTFTKAVVGEFSPDLRRSAFVLRSGDLYFYFDPVAHTGIDPVSTPGTTNTGLVTVPHLASASADQALVCSDAGADLASYDETTGAISFTSVLGSGWTSATGLVGRIDTSVDQWVVAGIAANGTRVQIATRDGSGNFIDAPSISVGSGVNAVQLADWDNDGGLEVVVFAGDGIRPYELNGTPLLFTLTSLTPLATTVIHGAGGVRDNVAAVVNAAGAYRVYFLNSAGNRSDVLQTSLLGVSGTMAVTGLAAADMDGTGNVGLLMSQSSSNSSLLMQLQASGTNYLAVANQAAVTLPVAVDPLDDVCGVVWTDLDGGSPEALYFLDSLPGVVVTYDLDGGGGPDNPPEEPIDAATYDSYGNLQLTLNATVAAGATRVSIVSWKQDSQYTNVSNEGLESTFELANGYVVTIPLIPSVPPNGLVWSGPYWANGQNEWIDLTFKDGDHLIHHEIVGMTLQQSSMNDYPECLSYLQSLPDSNSLYASGLVDVDALAPMQPVGGIVTRVTPPPKGGCPFVDPAGGPSNTLLPDDPNN